MPAIPDNFAELPWKARRGLRYVRWAANHKGKDKRIRAIADKYGADDVHAGSHEYGAFTYAWVPTHQVAAMGRALAGLVKGYQPVLPEFSALGGGGYVGGDGSDIVRLVGHMALHLSKRVPGARVLQVGLDRTNDPMFHFGVVMRVRGGDGAVFALAGSEAEGHARKAEAYFFEATRGAEAIAPADAAAIRKVLLKFGLVSKSVGEHVASAVQSTKARVRAAIDPGKQSVTGLHLRRRAVDALMEKGWLAGGGPPP